MLLMLFTRKFLPPTETGVKKLVSKFFLSIVPKNKYDDIRRYCEKRIIKLGGKSGYYCPVPFGDVSRCYPFDMFDDLKSVKFENETFYITSKWEECLTIRYGDYSKLPPKEEQIWKHHPLLISLEHNFEDINKSY